MRSVLVEVGTRKVIFAATLLAAMGEEFRIRPFDDDPLYTLVLRPSIKNNISPEPFLSTTEGEKTVAFNLDYTPDNITSSISIPAAFAHETDGRTYTFLYAIRTVGSPVHHNIILEITIYEEAAT